MSSGRTTRARRLGSPTSLFWLPPRRLEQAPPLAVGLSPGRRLDLAPSATSASVVATISPSRMTDLAGSPRSTLTSRGNRRLKRDPLRLKSSTSLPSLWIWTRKPSNLISCRQSLPAGTVLARTGLQGWMNRRNMPQFLKEQAASRHW